MKNPLKHKSKEMRQINTTNTSNSTNGMEMVLPQASKMEPQIVQPKDEPQSSKAKINLPKIPKFPSFFLLLLLLFFFLTFPLFPLFFFSFPSRQKWDKRKGMGKAPSQPMHDNTYA
ncbi:hypothetical protein Dimus_038714 [Dionaea muscipula]